MHLGAIHTILGLCAFIRLAGHQDQVGRKRPDAIHRPTTSSKLQSIAKVTLLVGQEFWSFFIFFLLPRTNSHQDTISLIRKLFRFGNKLLKLAAGWLAGCCTTVRLGWDGFWDFGESNLHNENGKFSPILWILFSCRLVYTGCIYATFFYAMQKILYPKLAMTALWLGDKCVLLCYKNKP